LFVNNTSGPTKARLRRAHKEDTRIHKEKRKGSFDKLEPYVIRESEEHQAGWASYEILKGRVPPSQLRRDLSVLFLSHENHLVSFLVFLSFFQ
jgi:hypothetical protein